MLGLTNKHLTAIGIVVLGVAAFTIAAAATESVTVGQFVQELARAKNLAATDPQTAADALAAAGVSMPAGLDFTRPLTEGEVARLSRTSGLQVTATNETALFDARQLDQFFVAFSDQLAAGTTQGITLRSPGDCVLDEFGICALPGADCLKNGKPGFCQPTTNSCTCNTGRAKGKRKQVITVTEPG